MILYLDCSCGISGDMLVAALLGVAGDTAADTRTLDAVVRPALKAAGIDPRLVSLQAVEREGVSALAFRVPEAPGFATFDELIMSMYASRLEQAVADDVAALAERMAAAERAVHGADEPHLDELAGIDTAVDLISAVTLLHHVAPARVVASPVAVGAGTVETAHGTLDVPAPAVAVLLRGLPTVPGLLPDGREPGELSTPTGAALLAAAVAEFGPAPAGPVAAVGIGAGTRTLPGRPNVLRAALIEPRQEESMDENGTRPDGREGSAKDGVRRTSSGVAGGVRRLAEDEPGPATPAPSPDPPTEPEPARPDPTPAVRQEPGDRLDAPTPVPPDPEPVAAGSETKAEAEGGHVLLEANIDDMTPELLAHAAEALLEAGARDVWMTQALMKKGRPGVVLHVLAAADDRQALAEAVFRETTTFGLRVTPVDRLYAEERRETVRLGGHEIAVRLSLVGGRLSTVSPEYEDCRRVAAAVGRPARVVYEAAQAAARKRFSGA